MTSQDAQTGDWNLVIYYRFPNIRSRTPPVHQLRSKPAIIAETGRNRPKFAETGRNRRFGWSVVL